MEDAANDCAVGRDAAEGWERLQLADRRAEGLHWSTAGEPRSSDREEVTASYLRCLRVLMAGSGYPMVASHDPEIIEAVPAMVHENNRGVGDFEYQMLYGIRDAEQRRLADAGNHVRVYVPFATQWYGYFVRRIAERPANLTFFLRALAERRH